MILILRKFKLCPQKNSKLVEDIMEKGKETPLKQDLPHYLLPYP